MATVLETRDLKKHYWMGASTVRALDGVPSPSSRGRLSAFWARAAKLDPIQALRHD